MSRPPSSPVGRVADLPPEASPALQQVARQLLAPIDRFLSVSASSGIVLMVAAAIALIWANSPWQHSYHALWHTKLVLGIGTWRVEPTLHFVVNDVLMVVFFFVVGLEIKREVYTGELQDLRRAALPLAAALGGMLLPAAIFLLFARGHDSITAGWGIPMATDIAFAVGILALLGARVPPSLRIFLLALAIIDDLGAIVIIALFYTAGVQWPGLVTAVAGVFAIRAFQWLAIRTPWLYVLPGAVVWVGVLQAGVHPTIAGVIVGMMTPMRPWYGRQGFVATTQRALEATAEHPDDGDRFADALDRVDVARREAKAPGERIEHALHPWVAFGVMPIFAVANAGVSLDALQWDAPAAVPLLLAVSVGLVAGKTVGIFATSWLTLRLGWAVAPDGVATRGLLVAGAVSGVGFTMSLFVASLAFQDGAELEIARFAVVVASAVAATFGLGLGRLLPRSRGAATVRP
ncbi:MAG: Na+/H+ antiporter NhaA [Planctomycetota bacterium]